jgi:transcriptional regulator with XRE-family HTH domain
VHFLALVALLQKDFQGRASTFFDMELSLDSEFGIGPWLQRLRGDLSVQEIAERLSADRTTVSRWLKGTTTPKLPELLAFIELGTRRLLDFVALLVDPRKLDSTRRAFEALLAQRKLAYDAPWSHAVLRALELSAAKKKYQPGFIAERIGITLEEEQVALEQLVRADQVRFSRGRYRLANVLPIDTRADPEANFRLKRHWLAVASERLERTRAVEDGLFSYNLFAVTDAGFERLRQLHVEYFERIRTLVAEERGGDRVVLGAMQLAPLDE